MKLKMACAWVATAFPLLSSAAGETVTALELAKRQQAAPFKVIVDYCRQNAPEYSLLMDAGSYSAQRNIDKAFAMWRAEKPGRNKDLDEKIPIDSAKYREATQGLKEMEGQILKTIQQSDPRQYCEWATNQFDATTAESILEKLHEYDARVEAKLK